MEIGRGWAQVRLCHHTWLLREGIPNMVGVVLVSHGRMAEATLEAARMIVGEQEDLAAVGLPKVAQQVIDVLMHARAAVPGPS